jgi:hypothetical protein
MDQSAFGLERNGPTKNTGKNEGCPGKSFIEMGLSRLFWGQMVGEMLGVLVFPIPTPPRKLG